MSITATNAERFLQANKRIVNKVSEQCHRGTAVVKPGYVRYSYTKHNILKIIFYATKENVELSLSWGCLPYGGLGDIIVQDNFINVDDTKEWDNKEWDKYIQDVVKYITKLIEFTKQLNFSFESYCNYCVDYKPLIKELMKDIPETEPETNASWWINKSTPPCEYCINAFAGFPVAYYQIKSYLEVMKILQSIMHKNSKVTLELDKKKEKTGKEQNDEDYGKALLKILTDSEREKAEQFIYIGE